MLDSVYPPDVDAYTTLVPGAERAFEELQAACDEDLGCAAAYPDLVDRVAALYDELEASPAEATGAHPETGAPITVRWDGDRMMEAAFLALYDASIIPLLPSLLEQFEQRQFDLATGTYLSYVTASGETTAEGLYLAVECRERAPFTDRDELERQAVEEPDWLLSAALAETSLEDCDIWTAPAAEPDVTEPVRSAVPTLVLAGRFDPITPPEWGREVADGLEQSYFRELPDAGHAVSTEDMRGPDRGGLPGRSDHRAGAGLRWTDWARPSGCCRPRCRRPPETAADFRAPPAAKRTQSRPRRAPTGCRSARPGPDTLTHHGPAAVVFHELRHSRPSGTGRQLQAPCHHWHPGVSKVDVERGMAGSGTWSGPARDHELSIARAPGTGHPP